jgi:two-component system, OmpR family, sensor kinase
MLRRLSLRARLLGALVGLLAVVCVVVGVTTVLLLRGFLLDRLDAQLTAAGGRSSAAFAQPAPGSNGQPPGGPQGGDDGEPRFLLAPGQGAGTLGARIVGGTVEQAAVLDAGGNVRALTAAQQAALRSLAVDGRPHTISLGSLGDYRLIASRAPDGDVLVTGLPAAGVQDTVMRLALVIAVVAALGLGLATLVGAAIIKLTLRPLRRVAATAAQVTQLPLDRGEVAPLVRVDPADTDPRTEVGQVGASLNLLLGHVGAALAARQESETRVRQFVADASHELRTPLAAIRGYSELSRRSREPVPDDIARALARVESEAARMTVLVDDLLLLARLDSGRPLACEPLDLSRLVADAVSDAHAASPEHRWRLDLPDEPVLVDGDPERLHQVVANLLANARSHTPPGTTVTAGLRAAHEQTVDLSVTDDGPGVDPALQPVLFERFSRGDSSRSRAAGSTGLGLAIVAAVVEAHGGEIAVTSRPGCTTFAVRLPVSAAADRALSERAEVERTKAPELSGSPA